MMLMTEKPDKDIPQDEHGYWGGFSPERKGKYTNQHLTKKFSDGRARIYPARKRSILHSDSQEVGSKKQSIVNTVDSVEGTEEQSLK